MTPFGKSSPIIRMILEYSHPLINQRLQQFFIRNKQCARHTLETIFSACSQGGFMAVSGPIGKISPMKASSQSKKSTDTPKLTRWEKPDTGFFDNLKLSHEMVFPLVPNPAPANTSNSNPPGGLGWWKSQVLQKKSTFPVCICQK